MPPSFTCPNASTSASWSTRLPDLGCAPSATTTIEAKRPFDIGLIAERIKERHARGRFASIVVVAEGAQPRSGSLVLQDAEVDAFGHVKLGGIAQVLAEQIEARTGFETRMTILGHVQRGGTPTAFDRVLSTRFGIAAIDAVHDRAFGQMVSSKGDAIVRVPLADAVGELKTMDPDLYHEVAEVFFG